MLPSDVSNRVSDALLNDPRTAGATIDVATEHGMVSLTGTVASVEVRQAAEEVARAQKGVVTVMNELKVKA
jgi:osmotically-inducible protein OsmY